MIRLIELFAGIGAQAKALEVLGVNFEHYKVCENDKNCIKSYNAIHNTNFEISDITKLKGKDLEVVETDKYTYLMTYSFPCQDLSICGKQAGMNKEDNTRSGLLWEVERLLDETEELPQILLMENVVQVHSAKNKDNFQRWLDFLESKGYTNNWCDLNSKDYGSCQDRKRCYLVSYLGNKKYNFPVPHQFSSNISSCLDECVDTKYYLSDTKKINIYNWKAYQRPLRRVLGQFSYCPTLTARGAGEYHAGMILYSSQLINTCDLDNTVSLLSYPIRVLTPRECWRIMGFNDDDFNKVKDLCSERELYKQAGNSIVVNVLVDIFANMNLDNF